MIKRILSAAVALPLFFVVIYLLPQIYFNVAIALICAVAAYELTWRSGIVKSRAISVLSILFAAAMPFFIGLETLQGYILALLFLAVVSMFVAWLSDFSRVNFEMVLTGLFSAVVLPGLFSLILLIYAMENGKLLLLIPFIAAWMTDTGAYFVGVFFGKHKLAEKISPKKTIEGAIGGVAVCVLSFLAYGKILDAHFGISINYLGFVLTALVLSLFAQMGDLSFSLIKREYNIKDYGNLIPGHGGILDRFDSTMFTVPAAFIMLYMIGV